MIAPVTSHDAAAGRQPRPELLQIGPVAQLKAGRLPRRLVQLFVGLSLYGASMGMLVRSALGLDPWDVFHYGVSLHVPWTFGTIVVVISFAVLLLRIPLRQMPGLGTIANAVGIGVATDLTLSTTPEQHDLLPRAGLLLGGIVLNGIAGALYIGSQLGPGSRDGLMTGLHRRTGAPASAFGWCARRWSCPSSSSAGCSAGWSASARCSTHSRSARRSSSSCPTAPCASPTPTRPPDPARASHQVRPPVAVAYAGASARECTSSTTRVSTVGSVVGSTP